MIKPHFIKKPKVRFSDIPQEKRLFILGCIRDVIAKVPLPHFKELGVEASEEALIELMDQGLIKVGIVGRDDEQVYFNLLYYHPVLGRYKAFGDYEL